MEIAVCGHVCLDIIPRWEKGSIEAIVPGNLIEMEGVKFATGGAVANTGQALEYLGIDTFLGGKIGDDVIGEIILDILEKESMIISSGETSSYTVVLNPPDTDRIFLHYPGPNHTYKAEDVPYQKIKEAKLFHFGYPPLMDKMYQNRGQELVDMFARCRELGLITSLDMAMPGPDSAASKVDWAEILRQVLPFVDIFLPSFEEINYLLDRKDCTLTRENLREISDTLLAMGAQIVVLKLGEEGLFLRTGSVESASFAETSLNPASWSEKTFLCPCFEVSVAGTTGAGDSAIAGFLAEVIAGSNPREALLTAAGTGAHSVEQIDAVGGIRPLEEVKKRIRNGWPQKTINFVDQEAKELELDTETGIYSLDK
ncbi:MAG: carbohydrate kinase family protein [bacterium]